MAEVRIFGIPSRLYRFRCAGNKLDRELDALVKNYIFCPRFDQMNDPMEGVHTPGLAYMTKGRFRKDMSAIRLAQKNLGIASFSEVFDYETMWAHYADQFKGFCIGYKTQTLIRELDDSLEFARMNYNDLAPVLFVDTTSPEDKAKLTLNSKSVRWMTEREWRLFSPKNGKVFYRTNDPIYRVYLGAKIDLGEEREIVARLKPLGISLVKMRFENYKIAWTGEVGK